MKQLLPIVLTLSLFSAVAQQKYLSISGGYGFGVPGNGGAEIVEYSSGKRTETLKHLNFGGGLLLDLAYGSPLSKNVHFELGVGYQNNLGSTMRNTYYREEYNSANRLIEKQDHSTRTIYASSFRFAPGFRFMAGEGKTRGFAKVAPQLIFAQVTGEYEFQSDTEHIVSEDEYSRKASIGFTTALGFEFNLSERIIMFSSINASLGYYSPEKWELLKYEINERDIIDRIPLKDKEIYYEKEVETNSSNQSPLQATRLLKTRMDYSSISLNLGVRFLL